MQEKRGILGGEKDNMVKSQPKKEVNILNICCFFNNIDKHYTEQIHKTICYNGNRTIEFIKALDKMVTKFLHKNNK